MTAALSPKVVYKCSGTGFFPDEIKHQTFAHERVEKSIQKAGRSGLFHDIPGQESVVCLDQGVMIPGGSYAAFEPPVGGVKAVSIMGC